MSFIHALNNKIYSDMNFNVKLLLFVTGLCLVFCMLLMYIHDASLLDKRTHHAVPQPNLYQVIDLKSSQNLA